MAKKEDSKYTYTMFSEVLPLAFSLSSIYTRAALNILRKLRIRKQKVSFNRIINHSNRSRHI